MFVLSQTLRPQAVVSCANSLSMALLPSRATSSRPRSPPHELPPPLPCSRTTLGRHVRFVFASVLIRFLFHVMCDIAQGGQDYNNPRSSSQCSACETANSFPLGKTKIALFVMLCRFTPAFSPGSYTNIPAFPLPTLLQQQPAGSRGPRCREWSRISR